jgi:hypothetical protein
MRTAPFAQSIRRKPSTIQFYHHILAGAVLRRNFVALRFVLDRNAPTSSWFFLVHSVQLIGNLLIAVWHH